MSNEELINDSATDTIARLQARIYQLESTIEAFKKYDKKRKEYYKNAIIKLGQLEAFVEEISSEDEKVTKLKIYKEQLSLYNKKSFLDKISRLSDIEIVATYDSTYAKQREKQLKATVDSLRASNRDLFNKYFALLNKTASTPVNNPPTEI